MTGDIKANLRSTFAFNPGHHSYMYNLTNNNLWQSIYVAIDMWHIMYKVSEK